MGKSHIVPTSFLEGSLVVYQPKIGYRFGIDSVLLANFLELKRNQKILEIGAGCGIISLICLKRFPEIKIFALEYENIYIECLKRSLKENQLNNRVFLIQANIKDLPLKSGIFDVIFANPPYYKAGAGRESPIELENIARREKNFTLENFFQIISYLLKNRGKFFFIFTSLRLAETIFLLKKYKLEPKILRFVHSYPGSEAKMVLILAVKSAGEETRIAPPLFIYNRPKGDYTEEVKKMFKKI